MISTVDPGARHGHKTAARGFDGYKGHVAIDPDSELVTATRVTPGNLGDAAPATGLLADLLEQPTGEQPTAEPSRPVAYGDNAYGTGELHALLERSAITDRLKTQPPVAPQGRFGKDRFAIDLEAGTVTCRARSPSRSAAIATDLARPPSTMPAPPARLVMPARPPPRAV